MRTKLFKSGNSQAVRIPATYRLETELAEIEQLSTGQLLITPIYQEKENRADRLIAVMSGFSADFVEHLERDRYQPVQEREEF
ncbi:antitoxin [Pelistega suis]|nr:hypothetical protein [Pelistega suis]